MMSQWAFRFTLQRRSLLMFYNSTRLFFRTALVSYWARFSACAYHVVHFLASCECVSSEMRMCLLAHLARCLSEMNTVIPAPTAACTSSAQLSNFQTRTVLFPVVITNTVLREHCAQGNLFYQINFCQLLQNHHLNQNFILFETEQTTFLFQSFGEELFHRIVGAVFRVFTWGKFLIFRVGLHGCLSRLSDLHIQINAVDLIK